MLGDNKQLRTFKEREGELYKMENANLRLTHIMDCNTF